MSNSSLLTANQKSDLTTNQRSNDIKRAIWIIALIAFYFIVVHLLPTPEGLSIEGKKALVLMICAVVAWVVELMPLTITTIFFVFMQPVTGVMNLGAAVGNFATPTILFVIAAFFLAIAMQASGISNRVALKMAAISKGDPKKFVLYTMVAAGAISIVVSDIPTAAAFLPIAMALIKKNNLKIGSSNLAKSLMIGIPVACLIGGVGTPVGCSMNVLAMDTLRRVTEGQSDILFYQWTAIGIPMVVVLIPIAYKIIIKVFPPEIDELAGVEDIENEYKALGPINSKEVKFICVLILCLVLWFTDWAHHLPLPITTTIAVTLFFLPFMNILNFENVKNRIPLDIILLIGAGSSLGSSLGATGAAEWLGLSVLKSFAGASPVVLIIAVAVFVTLIHLVCPVNAAIVSFMVPALVSVAASMGINPAALVVPMAFTVSSAFLIPLDPTPLVTFSEGHYKMTDYFKPGWIISIFWIIFIVIFLLLIARPIGLF